MLTLLSECHFWTYNDGIRIKDTDLGAFKYATKKDFDHKNQLLLSSLSPSSSLCKKDYVEKRDGIVILKNRKPTRLKENIKKFEDLLKSYKIVHSEWNDSCSIRILFSNGLLVYLCINIYTGDLLKIAYDKYFVGKLASDIITDAIFTRQHILLAYNTNQITMVYLQKPNMKKIGPEKISNMDPKIFHVLIQGSSQRKLPRHLAINDSYDLITIWTKSSQSEIYPWKPTIRDQDRANIHIYKLRSIKIEAIAYCWTENDPITVEFLRTNEGCVLTLEQKVSRKGEITAEIFRYEINQGKMKRCFITSILIGTQICCYSFSPDQEKLFLGTIDRYVCIHDLSRKCTKFKSRTDIIPIHCSWHSDSGLIIISNDRSQLQCFDAALSFIANQLTSEDVTPSNLLDLSHYFAVQPNLLNISFSQKPHINLFSREYKYAQTDCFLFMVYENGPIGCLRFYSGIGIKGDIHNSGYTVDVIIGKYLSLNHLEKAVNLLLTLNWETYGTMCLISLHQIANYVFRKSDVKTSRNELLHKALSSFTDNLSDEIKDEFDDQIIDLKRRFFFFLLRHHLFNEAFEIARNVGDYDLFMDLFNITKSNPVLSDLSNESYLQAELCVNQSRLSAIDQRDHIDEISNLRTDCNANAAVQNGEFNSMLLTKVKTDNRNSELRHSQLGSNYTPPLPKFKSPFLNDERIKINIPKPELRNYSKYNVKNNSLQTNSSAFKPLFFDSNKLGVNQLKNAKSLPTSSRSLKNFRNTRSEPICSTNRLSNTFNLSNPNFKQKLDEQSWSQMPDQTLGIPVAMPLLKSFPRSNTKNVEYCNPSLSHNQNTIKSQPSTTRSSNQSGNLQNLQSKYFQHPLVSKKIPSKKSNINQTHQENEISNFIQKPNNSLLFNDSTENYHIRNSSNTLFGIKSNCKKDSSEKNKVKFSDTIQVAVVPETLKKDKPILSRRNGFYPLKTDPEKELADSLPLCHPNDEYLKDFNLLPEHENTSNETESMPEEESDKNSSGIKVVHFGVV